MIDINPDAEMMMMTSASAFSAGPGVRPQDLPLTIAPS